MAGRKTKDKEVTEKFNKRKLYPSQNKDVAKAKRQAKREQEKKELSEADDTRSSDQMLADMRWVYRSVKGRTRLKKLCKEDDKQFVFMVKELMKIEAAKILKSKDGDVTNNTVFVVLKGLDEEKKYLVDDTVDLKQVQHVIQPESGEYEAQIEEEKMDVIL